MTQSEQGESRDFPWIPRAVSKTCKIALRFVCGFVTACSKGHSAALQKIFPNTARIRITGLIRASILRCSCRSMQQGHGGTMGALPNILTDGDLRLRPLVREDLAPVTGHFNDARVSRWLAAVVQPFGPEAAHELLAHGAHPGENLRIVEHQGVLAGGLCLGASLWYWLAPEFWRRGLMRRALTRAVAARFTTTAPPLVATCHVDNSASRALLTGLGFSLCPAKRRMFFHGTQTSEPCRDYLLAPEQWHLLHPPCFTAGDLSLRPATQKDAPTLALMLPTTGHGPWPACEALPGFIEEHRCRCPGQGLFVIADDNRRNIGMALLGANVPQLRFQSEAEDIRYRAQILHGLTTVFAAGS
ncbi:GNAT family N-acetyltransferase [Sedimentitalea sp. JM2-8]|uniref:GNAT family N-acetyltransferase n=1 Tax=Sedimentitalea xiamensis TaxID=3050037 RepID=A0ABT7FIS0_9RHOB|nr:GNAT family N-acetyltransferase [Sedimentitalea xiamensis]MDK3075023.1 GNAT family N-acetyltransferase [Sedimentitalea xiamensis]